MTKMQVRYSTEVSCQGYPATSVTFFFMELFWFLRTGVPIKTREPVDQMTESINKKRFPYILFRVLKSFVESCFLLPVKVFNFLRCFLCADLGRMYQLASRVPDGLSELRALLETHIVNKGLSAVEKLGEDTLNVSQLVVSGYESIVNL